MAGKNENLQLQQQASDEFLCLSSGESEEIDLSYWEFINPSDADDDVEDLEIDEISFDSIDDDDGLFVSWYSSVANSIVALENSHFGEGKSVLDDVGVRFIEKQIPYVGDQSHDDDVDEGECCDYYKHVYDDSDGYDDDDNDVVCDLDDELVPRAVSGKLGRQRMRKLGKRASAKVNSSKRAPFSYVKPGAVHGKHGLGMKYNC